MRLLLDIDHNPRRRPAGAWGDDSDPAPSSREDYGPVLWGGHGDWSWNKVRDDATGDNFVTYRPKPHPLAGLRPGA